MLINLPKPIDRDQQVPITLTIVGKDGKKSTVEVKAIAQRPGDAPKKPH
jgi:copper(I)-binding protein